MLVTPEMAQAWLDTRNPDYERQLRRGRVEGMARDMKDGRFRFIGDPVRHTADASQPTGKSLSDGQHRLSAVVLSGVPQYFPVVDVPGDAQHLIDTGAKRNVPDMLRKLGIATGVMGKVLTAVANKVNAYDLGFVGSRGSYRPTADESIIYIRRHEDALVAATEVGQQVTRYKLPVSASTIGAMWLLSHRVDAEAADEFWVQQVIRGANIEPGLPAYAYRDRIFRYARAGRRLDPNDAMLYGAVAWNHFRQGNLVEKLQAPRGGFTNRAIPLR
jgi:hypothetical protein